MTLNLKAERLNRGLSVRAAAAEMGIPFATLARAENGMTPQPANAKAIADFYGVKVTDIWPVDPTPTPERQAA